MPNIILIVNYFISIQLQAVCDHQCQFLDIFVGYPGSVQGSHLKAGITGKMVGIPAPPNPSPSSLLTGSLSETLLRPDLTGTTPRHVP